MGRRRLFLALAVSLSLTALGGCREKTEEPALTLEEDSDTIAWQGKEYRYNDHLSNFLFLGVDTRETVETKQGHANAGQSDSIFLVSWDRVTGETALITIPRDTVTQIEVFSYEGDSLGSTKDHISLAYAYGDGKYKSLELAEEAVSKLFYELPIQGVCAMSLDGIPVLADSLGGVEVTVPNDSLQEAYPEYSEGSRITLTGENAETFLRYRDQGEHHSALARMERQQAFLNACAEQVKAESMAELYEALTPYLVTNIGKDQLVKLLESASKDAEKERWTLPGEAVEGEIFDEYHVDDGALYEAVLETFYEEVE